MFKIVLLFLWGVKNVSPTSIDFYYEADILNRVLLGLPGYNESSLITVIYEKKYGERQKLIAIFQKVYGEEMYKKLWNKLAHVPRELTMGIIDTTPTYYDAKILIFALTGVEYDEDALFEVMATRTAREMRKIRKAYRILGNSDLCDDIETYVMGDLEDILLALCKADRDESEYADRGIAREDCQALYDYGLADHFGTNEDEINRILLRRNYNQLRLMFKMFSEYKYFSSTGPMKKRSIGEMIAEEYSFNTYFFLQRYVKAVENLTGYFASLIRNTLDTVDLRIYIRERSLIRIIFGRAGVDLPEIVEEFGGKDKLMEEIGRSDLITGFTKQALIAILKVNC